jgi:hypothetical protein
MDLLPSIYAGLTSQSPPLVLGVIAEVLAFLALCLVLMPPGFKLTIHLGRRKSITVERRAHSARK